MEKFESNGNKAAGKTGKRKFSVEISETLQMTVEVEAESKSEAIRIVQDRYDNEEYVLTADNHVATDINVVE